MSSPTASSTADGSSKPPTLPIRRASDDDGSNSPPAPPTAEYDDDDITKRNEDELAAANATEAQFEVTVSPLEFNKLFRSGSMSIEDQGVTVSVTDPQTKRAGPAGIHKITTYGIT
ncbi:hypothetical protein FOZ62_031301, partial [Perkinsus olseni]